MKFAKSRTDKQLVQPCEDVEFKSDEGHWIEIELEFEDGSGPARGEEYCIKLPNGSEIRGLLNDKGWARVNVIEEPGNCEISFPKLDKEVWHAG